MKTTDYLEAAMRKIETDSNAELARRIGVGRAAITLYRSGERIMDDYTAAQIAELLDMPPLVVIAQANAERERNPTKRAYWGKFAAAVTVASVTFFLPMGAKDAYASTSYSGDSYLTTDYGVYTACPNRVGNPEHRPTLGHSGGSPSRRCGVFILEAPHPRRGATSELHAGPPRGSINIRRLEGPKVGPD